MDVTTQPKAQVNLWLDDYRPCPYVGNWVVAKNYDEAIAILNTYEVQNCSLDHDLEFIHYQQPNQSHYENTGYDVVKWMFEHNTFPKFTPVVHSLNPVGARRMAQMLSSHYDCDVTAILKPYRKP